MGRWKKRYGNKLVWAMRRIGARLIRYEPDWSTTLIKLQFECKNKYLWVSSHGYRHVYRLKGSSCHNSTIQSWFTNSFNWSPLNSVLWYKMTPILIVRSNPRTNCHSFQSMFSQRIYDPEVLTRQNKLGGHPEICPQIQDQYDFTRRHGERTPS